MSKNFLKLTFVFSATAGFVIFALDLIGTPWTATPSQNVGFAMLDIVAAIIFGLFCAWLIKAGAPAFYDATFNSGSKILESSSEDKDALADKYRRDC